MNMIIDVRETELIKLVKYFLENNANYKDIQLKIETLPIGDIIFKQIDGEQECEKLIIERKSLSDLASSIKDGRYDEQSYRLNGLNHHNHNIIYLIEGDVNRISLNKNKMMSNTEMITTAHLINNKYLLLQKGKKNNFLLVVE